MGDLKWQRNADCVSTRVEDDLVLLDLEGGMYFALNGTAAVVWEALADPNTEARLIDTLVGKYKISPEDCATSVQRLLAELSGKGLARTVG